jgi:hypothetical protein
MGRPLRCRKADVAAALDLCKGRKNLAARLLGVSCRTVERYAERWGSLRRVIADFEEVRLDTAETMLEKAFEAGEAWAICFYLKTKGKKRGYIEKAIIAGDPDAPLQMNHSGTVKHEVTIDTDSAEFRGLSADERLRRLRDAIDATSNN